MKIYEERKMLEHDRKRKRQELREKREREKRLKENDDNNQMEFPFWCYLWSLMEISR